MEMRRGSGEGGETGGGEGKGSRKDRDVMCLCSSFPE